MLVQEIIDRVRFDLGDQTGYDYAAPDISSLLAKIRRELNDEENPAEGTDVLDAVRKILADGKTHTGGEASLESIRAELNDTADIGSGIGTESIAQSVRAKLGDVPDAALGTTTAANIDVQSVIHYAAWGNIGGVPGTNGSINGSVQYASSGGMLGTYAEDGIKTIRGMRPDALVGNALSGGFQAALNLYVLARCIEGEVEVEADRSRYTLFYDRFMQAVKAVPPHIPDAVIANYIELGETEIKGKRPDLGLCNATAPLLEDFVMYHLSQSKLGETTALQTNLQRFHSSLNEIPYHYSSEELLRYIRDGETAVMELRPDAVNHLECFSDAVKSYAVCHALGRRFGKAAGTLELWQTHDANFKAAVSAVPYHWTDEELNVFKERGEQEIRLKRPDLANSAAENLCLADYIVFSAAENRIGKESGAGELYKIHSDNFHRNLETLPKHYSSDELESYLKEAEETLKSLRPDAVNENGQIRSDLQGLLIYYAVNRALDRDLSNGAVQAVWKSHSDRFAQMVQNQPYHWEDAELLRLLHDSLRDILMRRADARMDEYGNERTVRTEPELTEAYPLRESFAKASECYCVYGAFAARIGREAMADAKYQLWNNQYNNLIGGAS